MGRFFPAFHVLHKVHHALTVPVFQCDSAAHAQCIHPPNSVQGKAVLQPLFYRVVPWAKSVAEKSPNRVSQVTTWDCTSVLVEWSSLCHKLLAWKEKNQCTNKSSTPGSSLLSPFWATWESRVRKWVKIKHFNAKSGISRFEIETDFLLSLSAQGELCYSKKKIEISLKVCLLFYRPPFPPSKIKREQLWHFIS